jgi:diaminopimelate epimerase
MNEIPFHKYTSCGNNFVILDEINTKILTEVNKLRFAYLATNVNYGVGADNFLVIQSCKPETFDEINEIHEYWDGLPDSATADFILRMFEPDGEEALSCANGLISIANYLLHQYGIESARIMTEIPSSRPKVVTIGTHHPKRTNWTHVGHPRQIPPELAEPTPLQAYDDTIKTIDDIEITFRKHDLAPFVNTQSLRISGYLVFTGEPHLVIFPETDFSLKELSKTIFVSSSKAGKGTETEEKRISFGSWLIHRIGTYLNKNYAHIFPKGINVNFARLVGNRGGFEYRCFERGICRETLACGTGALAVSVVLRRLNQLDKNPITAWPHRCRWNDPGAHLLIEENENGWALHGSPIMLFEGKFQFQESLVQPESAVDMAAISVPQSIQPAKRIDCKSASPEGQPEPQVNSNCNLIS